LLTAAVAVEITNTGNDTLCSGQTATLLPPAGTDYLWNTGATTSSITISTPGTYTVNVDCNTSQPYTIFGCASVNLQLHFLAEDCIQGVDTFGRGYMKPESVRNRMPVILPPYVCISHRRHMHRYMCIKEFSIPVVI